MYPTSATVIRPRAAAFIARLPVEAWSPGLERTVRISDRQRALLVILARQPAHRLRPLAVESGYADAAGVSRALRQLERIGMIARSSTRGRHGSTVAWLRAGARLGGAAARSLADLMREALELGRRNVSSLSTDRKPEYRRTEREDTFPVTSPRTPVSAAMRAARALLDPRHFPDQARPGGTDAG